MKRILFFAVAVALLASAATASANTYDVYSCWAGAGPFHNPNVSSAAWVKDHTHEGGRFAVNDSCATNPTSGSMNIMSVSGASAANGQ